MLELGLILIAGLAVAACASRGPAPADESAAKDGAVVDLDGESHKLSKAWHRGPAVVVFYRGFW